MSDDSNQRSIKQHWSGVYGRGADTYGGVAFFKEGGQRLVELAKIPIGARVLDVGTGRGANLFPASERVGPAGRVIGIDLAEGMLRETAAEISRRGLENAEVRRMDAENLEFPDASFDIVLCGFVLFFLQEVGRALDGFSRVLKPGGRLAITGPDPTDSIDDDVRGLLWRMLPPYRRRSRALAQDMSEYQEQWRMAEGLSWPERQAKGALSFPRPDELTAALARSGFVEVDVVAEHADMVASDEEEWWTWQWSHMPRATLERLEPDLVEELKAALFKELQARKQADGIHERMPYLFTLATPGP